MTGYLLAFSIVGALMSSSQTSLTSGVYSRCKCEECKTVEKILEDLHDVINNNGNQIDPKLAQRWRNFDEI